MTEVRLPTPLDLMHPTLLAVEKAGMSATISDMEKLVPEIAELTEEQMSVVFPENGPHRGEPKVFYRMSWARTNLKNIGALENIRRAVWAITPAGRRYLRMPPDQANRQFRKASRRVDSDNRDNKQKALSDLRAKLRRARLTSDEDDPWTLALLTQMNNMDVVKFEDVILWLLMKMGFNNLELKWQLHGGLEGKAEYSNPYRHVQAHIWIFRNQDTMKEGDIPRLGRQEPSKLKVSLVLTTGSFNSGPRDENTFLIDGVALCALLKEYDLITPPRIDL